MTTILSTNNHRPTFGSCARTSANIEQLTLNSTRERGIKDNPKSTNKTPNPNTERIPPLPLAIAKQTAAQACAFPLKLPCGNSIRLKMPSMVKFRRFLIPAFLCTCRFLRPFPVSCAIVARFEWKRLSVKMACGTLKPV
jgi:hypothetical protein